MSDENSKEESQSITTHTTRERNLWPGIKDSHLAIGFAGLALGIVSYIAAKPHIDTLIQNFALARQQSPPPPPPVQATPIAAQPELPLAPAAVNEYVEEAEQPSRELEEVDHKNYQTTRRKPRNVQQSQFGVGIQGG